MEIRYDRMPGARFGRAKAQIYGERIEMLMALYGEITPKYILEDARDQESVFHDAFEWNNRIAAEAYRLYQARNILNHIKVVIVEDGKESEFPAFRSITIQRAMSGVEDGEDIESQGKDAEPSEQVYVSVVDAIDDEVLRAALIADAKRQIIHWQNRYRQYKELASIVSAIDRALMEETEVVEALA